MNAYGSCETTGDELAALDLVVAGGSSIAVALDLDCQCCIRAARHAELARAVAAHVLLGDAVFQRLPPEAARDVVDAADVGRKAEHTGSSASESATLVTPLRAPRPGPPDPALFRPARALRKF